ncbi:MAG TPA: hypothetical protein VJ464_01835 [Blastocatellia bacterium]|nr:hypothetical protein [Blastocatellia bacterium]
MAQNLVQWNQKAFDHWRDDRANVLKELLPDSEQGLKALLVLALLDYEQSGHENEGCTYDWIVETINKHKVTRPVQKNSIRTAVSNLKNSRALQESAYELRIDKAGLTSLLRLVKKTNGNGEKSLREARSADANQTREADDNLQNHILKVDPPIARPDDIAQALVGNLLPMYALYCLPRGAGWWLHASRSESEQRRQWEASAWEELGLRDLLLKQDGEPKTLGIIGLAVGEGLGEIELLRRILKDIGPEGRVHYLAIDMSPVMLLAHFDTLRDILENDLRSGRLVVSATLGNALGKSVTLDKASRNMKSLDEIIAEARSEFAARQIDFLPSGVPLLVTCFGNVLGNQTEPNEAVPFFTRLRDMLPNRPLSILTGVSIWGWKSDETADIKDYQEKAETYDDDWYDFLSTTPRHLLINLQRISSEHEDARKVFDPKNISKSGRKVDCFWQRFSKDNYLNFDVRAEIHRFYYTIRGDLRLNGGPSEQTPSPYKNGNSGDNERDILLFVVTRFDPDSLIRALSNQGFNVASGGKKTSHELVAEKDYAVIEVGKERREYVLISAFVEGT